MFIEITSKDNKICKYIKSLYLKKNRDKNLECLIEGYRIVKDTLKGDTPISFIAVNDDFIEDDNNIHLLEVIKNRDIKVYKFNNNLFKNISDTKNSQGIIGVVKITKYKLQELINTGQGKLPIYIFCDEIQDPGNMGTIIRTGNAAGINAIFVSKACVDVYNPKTVRSTMATLFHTPIVKINNKLDALSLIKEAGIKIIVADTSAPDYYFNVDMTKPTMIVIGNEANGVSDTVKNMSDISVKIPIIGQAESLNAGVSTGIIVYELLRQRWK